MLSESILARSSRSLLSSGSTSALARHAFHGASSSAGRGSTQAQQGAARSWALLRVTAAGAGEKTSAASKKQQADLPAAPDVGVGKAAQQVGVAPHLNINSRSPYS